MTPEVVLQVGLLILTLAMFFAIHNLSRNVLTKLRTNNRANLQSTRHFVHGSHLLTRARSTPHKAQSQAHAKNALTEAEKALSLSPRDPGPHILKALSLDLLGHKTSALKSLDVALSPPCVKSLSEKERGDALVKRAELKLGLNRRRRVDSAVEDLVDAVKLGRAEGDATAFCLLGQCYEWKGMRDEAIDAFERALTVDSGSDLARQGLDRLGS
ncbi:uncharacterized protein LOC103954711 [Pyrus x bretschneideri]|uniref:uncharacterized protein LOC103954711 n=1 Tax=Pyrus x bretschneideri TaxID=225117 RepID=UPI0005109C18|nr:uncharacterized protein LOC103954711 [Pyrus x bretschneideri]